MNILTSFRRRFIINGNWINLQIIHLGFHYTTGSSTMPVFILTSAGNFPQIQFPSTGGTKLQEHQYSEEANHACSVECLSKASVLLSVFGKKAKTKAVAFLGSMFQGGERGHGEEDRFLHWSCHSCLRSFLQRDIELLHIEIDSNRNCIPSILLNFSFLSAPLFLTPFAIIF